MPITINGSGTVTGISVGGLPDGIVDTDMLAANAVATAKIADSAVTSAKASGLGISEYDVWRCTDGSNSSQDPITTWTRESDKSNHFEKIGTGMTESSGIFSFPSTGKWLIKFNHQHHNNDDNERYADTLIRLTPDNGTSWISLVQSGGGRTKVSHGTDNTMGQVIGEFLADITSITGATTHKVRFKTSFSSSNTLTQGNNDNNFQNTFVSFMKIGET